MILAKNVSLEYKDGTLALKSFDLSVVKGEMIYISGPSGSGKTSLLKLLMGTEFPTTGSLEVLGTHMDFSNSKEIRKTRQDIGPIFQEFRLLNGRSVFENVLLGMRFLKKPMKEKKEMAEWSIERVGLNHKRDHLIDHLSWGESQRVAIARAVARKPRIIIADEPTGNLDDENAMNILGLLRSFVTKETSVLITTHATHLLKEDDHGTYIHIESGVLTLEKRGYHE